LFVREGDTFGKTDLFVTVVLGLLRVTLVMMTSEERKRDAYICELSVGTCDQRPLANGFTVGSLDIHIDDHLVTLMIFQSVSLTGGETCTLDVSDMIVNRGSTRIVLPLMRAIR
jgi:hypothetical protein